MDTKPFFEFNLSRLMLGTVQFGMPYGVANRTGQPTDAEVLAIIAAAIEGGVNSFDTAAAYGSSEAVLGRALQALGVADQVVVVTKVRALTPEEVASPSLAMNAIEQSVETSRRRLGLDRLPVVLFHREADARHLDALATLRDRGWVRHIGVSCDHRPGPALEFARAGQAEALQVPASVLDRRHRAGGLFQASATRGVGIFVRSIYLQGLLAMPEEAIPASLGEVIPVRRRLERVAAAAGMGLAELALRGMLGQEGVTSILTGVETVAQVRENIRMFNRGPLPPEVSSAVDAAVPELPERILSPSLWPSSARPS